MLWFYYKPWTCFPGRFLSCWSNVEHVFASETLSSARVCESEDCECVTVVVCECCELYMMMRVLCTRVCGV